jgi:uncharacterized protein DUF3786
LSNNYAKIVNDNLERLYKDSPQDLAENLPADQIDNRFIFKAFGEPCEIKPDGIFLGQEKQTGAPGILISLYALHATSDATVLEPLKAFKDFPNSMPYAGAFVTHTQQILVAHVDKIIDAKKHILARISGKDAPRRVGGDDAFLVYPLPKIALCYIFYEADEDFPASVTCLYSNNALTFLPIDGLADVGEYTSKKILELIRS